MGVVNLAAGALFALLGARRRELAALDAGAAPRLAPGAGLAYGAIALLVGFAMMALQTVVIRMAGLSFGSSEIHVLDGRLGVRLVHRAREPRGSALARIGRTVLVVVLVALVRVVHALYLVIETGPYWVHVLRSLFREQRRDLPVVLHRRVRGALARDRARDRALGAVLPLFHVRRSRRPRRAGGSPLQPEYAGVARGRADRRLCAVYWLISTRLPRGGRRARDRGGARDAARGCRGRAGGAGAALLAVLRGRVVRPWDVTYLGVRAFRERIPRLISLILIYYVWLLKMTGDATSTRRTPGR